MSDAVIPAAQTTVRDDLSIAATDTAPASIQETLSDDATLVSTADVPSPDTPWTPQSPFLRFYNTPTFPQSTLEYVASDPEADWADAPQEQMNENFFMNSLHFISLKTKSFFARLGRMTFAACL